VSLSPSCVPAGRAQTLLSAARQRLDQEHQCALLPLACSCLFLILEVRLVQNKKLHEGQSCCPLPPLLGVSVCPAQVRLVQNKKLLPEPVTLSNSTLRAVHGCHVAYMKNMGTQSTISLAVVVNDPRVTPPPTPTPLAASGLVVCHHEASRYVPDPLRLACEFLMQASGRPRAVGAWRAVGFWGV